jgi:hypothetical protein
MSREEEKLGGRPYRPVAAEDARAFAESLKQRRRAAQGLERDLLTDVPLLYGSPGSLEPHGDPGILLAKAHREELLRRHGAAAPPSRRSDVALPFEGLMSALAVLLLLFFFFA